MTNPADFQALIDRLHSRCSTAPCDEEYEIISKAAILLGYDSPVQYPDLWNALGANAYESAALRLLPPGGWFRMTTDVLRDGTLSVIVYADHGEEQGQAATLGLAITEAALAIRISTMPEMA